jgi:hypothetical protein
MWSEKDPNHLVVKNTNTYNHGIASSTATNGAIGITSSDG